MPRREITRDAAVARQSAGSWPYSHIPHLQNDLGRQPDGAFHRVTFQLPNDLMPRSLREPSVLLKPGLRLPYFVYELHIFITRLFEGKKQFSLFPRGLPHPLSLIRILLTAHLRVRNPRGCLTYHGIHGARNLLYSGKQQSSRWTCKSSLQDA
jgi:hypothetical protein